jgi:hypothetical protein
MSAQLTDRNIDFVVNYFESFTHPEEIINTITDHASISGHLLRGGKFPLCLVIEGLEELLKSRSSNKIVILRDQLKENLERSFFLSQFSYFEEGILPQDLDTAASMARILGPLSKEVINAYQQIIKRNRLDGGLVPTWLDTKEHHRWRSGSKVYHLDVMLNHWLTEWILFQRLDTKILIRTIKEFSLRNYWYIPSLYTSYLYAQLLKSAGLTEDEELISPLLNKVHEYDHKPEQFISHSNSCEIEVVSLAVKRYQSPSFNLYLRSGILSCIQSAAEASPLCSEHRQCQVPQLPLKVENTVLYWSLGYKPYASEPVTHALMLKSMAHSPY